MIRKAILLTPAKAENVGGQDIPAPMVKLGGISLIKRSLLALERQGIEEVVVVVGYRGEEVRRSISSDNEITARITWVETSDAHSGDNLSLVRARRHVDEPVLVLSSQLLFAPEILSPLADAVLEGEDAIVLVDRKLGRTYDLGSALKVRSKNSMVQAMGTDLENFDAVAVGIAAVRPEVLDALEVAGASSRSLSQGGEDDGRAAATRGVQALLGDGGLLRRIRTQEIDGSQWQQVNSPETRLHAEWLMRAYGEDLSGHDQGAVTPPALTPNDPRRTLSYIEGLLSEKNARHYVLFNPGPVLTSPRVKSALVHHDVCHRDSDYAGIVRGLKHKIRRVCKGGPEHDVVLFSGSGTASMEAAISSCVPTDGSLLVISNGAFGERFAEIAEVHDIPIVHLKYAWGELIDVQDVADTLNRHPEIVATIMCHHETSVGILNPIREVGRLCKATDCLYFVDAVSSLGGEDLDVRRDGIDVLISSANKCLHAISGVSFVCVNERVWPRIEGLKPRVYYLDLKRHHRISVEQSLTPFTPAVSSFFALDAALDEILAQGVSNRVAHYRALNQRLRDELRSMGMERFTDTGHESHSISTVKTPDYISFPELYEQMKARGYIIYGCKDDLQDRYFQVANMGELSEEMVQGFLDTLAQVLRRAASRSTGEVVSIKGHAASPA